MTAFSGHNGRRIVGKHAWNRITLGPSLTHSLARLLTQEETLQCSSLPAVANCYMYSNSVLISLTWLGSLATQFTRKFAAKKGGRAQSSGCAENNKSNFTSVMTEQNTKLSQKEANHRLLSFALSLSFDPRPIAQGFLINFCFTRSHCTLSGCCGWNTREAITSHCVDYVLLIGILLSATPLRLLHDTLCHKR